MYYYNGKIDYWDIIIFDSYKNKLLQKCNRVIFIEKKKPSSRVTKLFTIVSVSGLKCRFQDLHLVHYIEQAWSTKLVKRRGREVKYKEVRSDGWLFMRACNTGRTQPAILKPFLYMLSQSPSFQFFHPLSSSLPLFSVVLKILPLHSFAPLTFFLFLRCVPRICLSWNSLIIQLCQPSNLWSFCLLLLRARIADMHHFIRCLSIFCVCVCVSACPQEVLEQQGCLKMSIWWFMSLFEGQIQEIPDYQSTKLQEFGKTLTAMRTMDASLFRDLLIPYGRSVRTISSVSGEAELSALPYFSGWGYSRGITVPLWPDLENRLDTNHDHEYRLSASKCWWGCWLSDRGWVKAASLRWNTLCKQLPNKCNVDK